MEEYKVDFEQTDNLVLISHPNIHPTALLIQSSQKHMEFVCKDVELGINDKLPAEYQKAFQSLWEDEGVQSAIQKGHEYALHDNLE